MSIRFFVPLTMTVAALADVPKAHAAEFQTMASGACRSALPAFDGDIRTRPLAVQNEGTATAFVTCAQQGNLDQRPTQLSIFVVNNTQAVSTVSCTVVSGSTAPVYYAVSVVVLPTIDAIGATRPEAPALTFDSSNASWSCALPPGTGISRVGQVRLL